MTRRGFLQASGAAAFAAGTANAKPHTNIIVILADDLGYGDLSCYGSKTIRTPHLDRMAAEGVRFKNFYAAAPFCSPSRASILTGRYPYRAGVPNVLFPTETTGLPASETTLAELLKAQGYATACIGKWHLGSTPEHHPLRHGFDSFYGLPYSNDMFKQQEGEPFRAQHAKVDIPLLDGEKVVEAPVNQHTLTQRYTERAVSFLKENKDRPFFLYSPHTFPHSPQYASPAFEGRSPHGLYADATEEMDASVGTILDTLRELNIARQTLVVFTSDNGPAPGRPRDARWKGGSSGGLRGLKGSTWEGGMRVPGIFWQPGRLSGGRTVTEIGALIDVLPTAMDWAGRKTPRGVELDGISLRSVLEGKKARASQPRLFRYYFGEQLQAVRRGRWKLILPIRQLPHRPASLWYQTNPELFARHYRLFPEPHLYDLEADPAEATNVAADHSDIVNELSLAARSR